MKTSTQLHGRQHSSHSAWSVLASKGAALMLLPLDEHDELDEQLDGQSHEDELHKQPEDGDECHSGPEDEVDSADGAQCLPRQQNAVAEAGRASIDLSADSFERLGYDVPARSGRTFDGSQSIDYEESSFEKASYRFGFCSLPNTPAIRSPRLHSGTGSLPNTPLMRSPRISCPGSSAGRRVAAFNLDELALLAPATGWEISKRQNRAEASSGSRQQAKTPFDFSPPCFEQQLMAAHTSPGSSRGGRPIWAITQPRRSPLQSP